MNERSFIHLEVAMVGPSRDRRRDKHEQIMRAAVAVFAEKGFHAARVSDIARKAGVADGTIYLYFKNKEALLLGVFEETMDRLREGVLAALADEKDPLAKIRVFAQHHFEKVQENPEVAIVLQVELRQSKTFISVYRPRKLWDYLGVFEAILDEGIAQGVIRADVDPFTTKWAFFGSLDELGLQWAVSRKRRLDLQAAAVSVAEVFIRGVAA
ncbi:MAG: TetR/AcrR family transcriptional regulator [Alphaproteobacteria bacterium]|nr:TetR/AcrR family transcriptional regulator [Alphaproteobacteria bacterium]